MEADLPEELRAWVVACAGGRVVRARAHPGGASRRAWSVDIERAEGDIAALFLLADRGRGGGSSRDGAVLRALEATPVPVPHVWGERREPGCVLLERVEGRSDFPPKDPGVDAQRVARHLMQLAGALHALDPDSLAIPHLAPPARAQLAPIGGALRALGDAADPLFAFALGWLERHAPAAPRRWSLVHSDLGPGNFLYAGDEVRALLDWEVAHIGDPMEDLAALSVRDMATPVGPLARRFDEYEEASGTPVDLERVGYYRVLILCRNSLLIQLGLAHRPPGEDTSEMTMYATLLSRALALVLCDGLGALRPDLPPAESAGDADELEDLAKLLGAAPGTLEEANAALRERVAGTRDRAHEVRLASYFARRLLRTGERRRSLLGALADRLPEPLERR